MIGTSETISEVAQFYSNKSVFITGGSGFIGLVLIEKLLYSCKDLEKIYVLIRPKKSLTATQRVEKLLESVIFSRIKSKIPDVLKKLQALVGDMSLPDLGLSDEDQKMLIDNVSVVFHGAATLRFDDPLRTAMAINVDGTLQLLALSKRFRRLEAFIHISTAYSNIDRSYIEEKVYPLPVTLDEVYKFIKDNNSENDEALLCLAGRPNTYTFTKAIAENEVVMKRGNAPVAIVRPSVVLPVYKEPLEGWLMNWNGPTALLYYTAEGIYRVQKGDGNLVADLIPVDLVTNMIIVAATACNKSDDVKVYNCCTGPRNPITWNQIAEGFVKTAVSKGYNKLPLPHLTFFRTKIAVDIVLFLLMTAPCFVGDCFRRLLCKEPKYTQIARKLRRMEAKLNFGTSSQWNFEDASFRALVTSMTPEDRKVFYCDPVDIDWGKAAVSYYTGIRKYLMGLND